MSSKDFAGRGFDRVFQDIIGIPDGTVGLLRDQFLAAHLQMDFTRWGEFLESTMTEFEWQWPWFEAWMTTFRNGGFWPYQCETYMNAFIGRFTPTVETVAGYIGHLSDKEQRDYLKQRGRYPKPAPKRWAELCAAFQASDMDELRPLVRSKDVEREKAFQLARPTIMAEERLRILRLCLNAAAFSARERDVTLPQGWVRIAKWPMKDRACDAFTQIMIEAFNSGQSQEWPPAFPGDERWMTFRTPYDP
ncbi:hypothetical protein GCM10011317_32640 [Niveispirillum cyanobacteriorum]|nr:hypothetical protein GCM10011317_32640 [Niveispirillum cyanobacteriorum]